MPHDSILRNAVLPDGTAADIAIEGGLFAEIAAPGAITAEAPSLDLKGACVLPGLCDGHNGPDLAGRVNTTLNCLILQIAEGDKVATRFRFHGTNTGPYLGKAPTGRRAIWTGIEIDVVRGEKIEESWVDWDMHRMLQQLGHTG